MLLFLQEEPSSLESCLAQTELTLKHVWSTFPSHTAPNGSWPRGKESRLFPAQIFPV